jgi:hypothetical protein
VLGFGSRAARPASLGRSRDDIERLHRSTTPCPFTRRCNPGGRCARFQLYCGPNRQRSFPEELPRLSFGRQRPLGIRVSFFFRTALISGESCCRTHPCLHVVSLTLHLANAVDTPNDVADSSSDSTPYVVGSDSIVPTRVRSRGRHMLYHPLRCRVVGCTFGSTESKPMRKDHMRQHIRNMHTKVGKTD